MASTPLFKGLDGAMKVVRTGAQEQLWPDVLPAATKDLYGYQRELNSGSLGCKSVAVTSEPWALL